MILAKIRVIHKCKCSSSPGAASVNRNPGLEKWWEQEGHPSRRPCHQCDFSRKSMDLFFPQSTPQSYVLLPFFAGAFASLFSAAVSVTHRAAYQLTLLAPPGLPFSGPSASCLLEPP